MPVVTNTGPLIALAKLDQLALLDSLFGQVLVPEIVYRELLAKDAPERQRLESAFGVFLQVRPNVPLLPQFARVLSPRDAGEKHASSLACQLRATLLIADHRGRALARSHGIQVLGTIGVLIMAKDAGLIPQVMPLLRQVRDSGYWVSEQLMQRTARQTGEPI